MKEKNVDKKQVTVTFLTDISAPKFFVSHFVKTFQNNAG